MSEPSFRRGFLMGWSWGYIVGGIIGLVAGAVSGRADMFFAGFLAWIGGLLVYRAIMIEETP